MYVERVEHRFFDGPGAGPPSPQEREFVSEYLSDLVHRYGLTLREQVLERGGHRYQEMAEELIAALCPPEHPVDLVVLAYAVPDLRAGRNTATYRGHACPGDPLAFAVCDQGAAAAFTALHLASVLSSGEPGADGCGSSLLLVLEQPILAYEPAVPVTLPDRPAAVAVRCGPSGPARFTAVRQHGGVTPDRVGALLAAELADLCAGGLPVTVVAGGGLPGNPLPELPTVDRVRTADPGQPSTGVWRELAAELAATDADRRVVLAEYDPLGYLCLATFDR